MVTGIAQSFFDSTPVLYLTGNVTTTTYKYDLPLRQLGYQETDIISIVKPIVKGAYFADQAVTLPAKLRTALRDCLLDRTGPALLDIPFDTQKLDILDNELVPPPCLASAHYTMCQSEFDTFVKLLTGAQKPLILAGGGIQVSNSAADLADFARLYKIPVVHSLLGKDAFPNDDSLSVGFIGSYGARHANQVFAASDLVIALGSRFSSRQTAKLSDFLTGKKIIHVDIDPHVIGQSFQPDLAIRIALQDFFYSFRQYAQAASFVWACPEKWHSSIKRVTTLLKDDTNLSGSALNPKRFLRALSEAQPSTTTYCVDVGGHQMWTAQSCVVKEGGRLLYSGGLGTMGYAIPAAIGAWFADQSRRVFAICGDGGFQMSIPELQTVKEFNVPLKIVVFNNNMLGLMKNFQDENFDGRYPATVVGYSVPAISKLAEVYDIKYYRMTSDQETTDIIALLEIFKGPVIIEVTTPPEWGPYPKVLPGRGLTEQYPDLSHRLQKQIKEILQ